jgi:hypothetical protein
MKGFVLLWVLAYFQWQVERKKAQRLQNASSFAQLGHPLGVD